MGSFEANAQKVACLEPVGGKLRYANQPTRFESFSVVLDMGQLGRCVTSEVHEAYVTQRRDKTGMELSRVSRIVSMDKLGINIMLSKI